MLERLNVHDGKILHQSFYLFFIRRPPPKNTLFSSGSFTIVATLHPFLSQILNYKNGPRWYRTTFYII